MVLYWYYTIQNAVHILEISLTFLLIYDNFFFSLKCNTDDLGSLLCIINSTVKFQHSPANLSFKSYNKGSGKLQILSYKVDALCVMFQKMLQKTPGVMLWKSYI